MNKLLLILLICVITSHCLAQEGLINSPNSKLYYHTYGTGKPLLIINGGPGMNSNGFVALAMKLAQNNQTIIYDQRGTGKSTLTNINSNTITMELMAADLEQLRIKLKIEKWIILGHSFGGMLASYYATIYPDRIEKLILSSSGGIDLELQANGGIEIMNRLSSTEKAALNKWNDKISQGDTSFHARLQRGMNLAPAYVYDRKNIPIIAKRLTEGNSKINGLVWDDLHRMNFNCAEKLKSFTSPVLILQGKQDILSEKVALKGKKTFKNSTLIFIPHCGHYGWLDNPTVYFAAIHEFLKG